MKKRTVQILSMAVTLCLLILAISLIPSVTFAKDESFSITEKVIADSNTVWKYLDNNTDPAANYDSLDVWTQKGFDDSAWKTGSGSFGNKNGKLQTIFLGTASGFSTNVLIDLNDGTSDAENYKTYFFRTELNVDTLDNVYALSLKLNADDAAVVYINGKIVVDTRTTVNNTENLYYASSNNQLYRNWFTKDELKEFLTEGENTVAVSVHNADSKSSDVFFSFAASLFYLEGELQPSFDDVLMSVGSDETERNLTWYTRLDGAAEVQLAKAEDMNGGQFPEAYATFGASTARSTNSPGEYYNKATITGLSENTEYVYRLKCGSDYSDVYTFKTESFDSFDLIVFGDPQIRTWTDSLENPDYTYWHDTMNKVSAGFDADLYVSVGDQINLFDDERDYNHFITEDLASTPLAPTFGNHENGSYAFKEHYNLPNASNTLNANYWFTYNNVLFININNLVSSPSNHLSFIREAVTANPDCEWQILIMHFSPFSGGEHSDNTDVLNYTNKLVPSLNELGIDLVLGGHDHIYTRSYLMDGVNVLEDQSATDTDGILYVCAGATGGKFYGSETADAEYIAFSHAEEERTVIHLEVTKNTLSLNTYRVDDMSVIDSYTLQHSNSARLGNAIANAESTLADVESALSESMLSSIKNAINDAKTALESIDLYSQEEIDALITLLGEESASLAEVAVNYNKLSEGAESTAFDTVSSLKIVHLEDGGVYTLTGGGDTRLEVSLIKHNTDGTTTTVYTWKEGATYIKRSNTNPYVAFILDGDVTFNSMISTAYTNLLIDLKGHSITFNTSDKYYIYLKAASSIEIRGEGEMIAGTGTVDYFLNMAQYIGSMTLNGDITFKSNNSNLKNVFYVKGDAFVHGTFTIDESYNKSSGSVFLVQGSRSSADDRKGVISIENATVNFNNKKGASLFCANGVSGTSSTDGNIYTSIPEVNITSSTLNLLGPMIINTWGASTASGYGASKTDTLVNCVNATVLNVTDSYVYSDLHKGYPITITPSGYTTINVTRSTFYSEHGIIFQGIKNNTLILNATDSVFFADTTNAEASVIGPELGVSSSAYNSLRGEVLVIPAETLGTATFNNCSLTAAYRVLEAMGDTLDERDYSSYLNDCSVSLTDGGSIIFTRVNVVFDGGYINYGSGNLSYKVNPYNPDTGKGLLVKGTVVIVNFKDSKVDSEVKTISNYKTLAQSDSSVYSTLLSTGYFTVADDFNTISITHKDTAADKYSFILYSTDHECVLTVTKGVAPTCTESGTNDYYTCFCGKIYADSEAKIPVDNLEAYLPAPALGHTSGVAVTENNVSPTCTEAGKYELATYCVTCGTETSRETVTVDALGHTEETVSGKDATCTENGLTDGKKCSVCGETLVAQEEIPALGHNYDAEVTAPDCTNGGYTTYTCSVCGDNYVADETAALGHTEETVAGKAPTCAETGLTDGKKCSVCGETLVAQEEIPALGHNYDAEVTAPDCTNGGYTTYTCSVCGDNYASDHTDALGHTEETVAGKAPTCTETGLTDGKKCSVCGETLLAQEEIPANGHNYNAEVTAPDCTNGGYTTYTCSVCGDSYVADETTALGHTYGEAVTENNVAPTCTESGSYDTVVYCSVCSEELSREAAVASALGHEFLNYVYNEDATCLLDGSKTAKCTRCDETDTLLAENTALGHTDGEALTENNTDPTCTEAGKYELATYCVTCGTETSRETVAVDALGHNYSEFISNSDGTHTRVCANDTEHTETEVCQGGTATETELAACSVCGGAYGEYKEPENKPSETPNEGETPESGEITDEDETNTKASECEHICHNENIFEKILWSILNFFAKLFGTEAECACGEKHY